MRQRGGRPRPCVTRGACNRNDGVDQFGCVGARAGWTLPLGSRPRAHHGPAVPSVLRIMKKEGYGWWRRQGPNEKLTLGGKSNVTSCIITLLQNASPAACSSLDLLHVYRKSSTPSASPQFIGEFDFIVLEKQIVILVPFPLGPTVNINTQFYIILFKNHIFTIDAAADLFSVIFLTVCTGIKGDC